MERLQAVIALSLAVFLGFFISAAEGSTIIVVLGGLVGAAIGLAIVAYTARKPQMFWPILIVGSIVSTGFMLHGYTMADEYVVGCLILGSLAAGAVRPRNLSVIRSEGVHSSDLDRLHRFVFAVWIMYMLFECFRGMIVLSSPRKVRWIVYFLMLGILMPILSGKKYSTPSVRKMSFLVVAAALIYFSFYSGYGLFFELLGINRYDLQYAMVGVGVNVGAIAIWGTTAYTMFPLVIAMPACFIIINDKSRVYRLLGWITLLVSACTALYYDSRVAILTITAFMLISLFSLGIRRWLTMVVICVFILSFFFSFVWQKNRNIGYFLSDTFGTISSLRQAEQSGVGGHDIDRYVWAKAGLFSISDSWQHFLFGYGFRTSGHVVAPHVYDLFISYKRPKAYDEDVSTEAITNLLVDTGMVGLLLLLINFILVAFQIWRWKGNPNRNVLILSLFIMFGWLFVINIVDVMLFYLMIMPSGFLVQLSRYNSPQGSNDPQNYRTYQLSS